MNKFVKDMTLVIKFNMDADPKFEKVKVTACNNTEATLRFPEGKEITYQIEELNNTTWITIDNVKMPMSAHDSALDFLLTHCKGEVGKCVDLKTTDGTMTKVIDVQVGNFIVTLFESEEAFGIYTLDDEPVGSEDIPLRFLRHIVPPMLDIHELTADA